MKQTIAILTLVLMTVLATPGHAQDYRYEMGPSLGVSGYLGDVNNSNMWKHPGVTGGGIFRYILNSRWAVKGNLNYASISGNSDDIQNKFPVEEPYKFKSSLVDLGGQVEFNFFHFGSGPSYKNYKRLSPYMTLGLGAVMSSTSGSTNFAMVLPMGLGVKYKLKERLNLGFEFTMRKSFGDKIDNLTDLYGVQHGVAKNTDWYSLAMFTVTYEFSKRCVKCHYID
ncbi:MAG: porin family protein [Muribaculaceae bacterium]|nr:porin family protein [Muribaculaceae bacterium]